MFFFFMQKTAYEMRISDWSSDVCSSDLRAGRFSTELFERYQRSEQVLVATLAEMYVQGVSTRKVKAITDELCGHAFSASTITAINKKLDRSEERRVGKECVSTGRSRWEP